MTLPQLLAPLYEFNVTDPIEYGDTLLLRHTEFIIDEPDYDQGVVTIDPVSVDNNIFNVQIDNFDVSIYSEWEYTIDEETFVYGRAIISVRQTTATFQMNYLEPQCNLTSPIGHCFLID